MKNRLNGIQGYIAASVLIPLLAFLGIILYQISVQRSVVNNTEVTARSLTAFENLSDFIHELQKERARSVSYSGGSTTSEELESQQKITDSKILAMNESFALLGWEDEILELSKKRTLELKSIRTKVLTKSFSKGDLIKFFTDSVEIMAQAQNKLGDTTKVVGIPVIMRSVSILESVKETTGRLRANALEVIGTDAAISKEKYKLINSLMESIDSGLQSPGLVISSNVREMIVTFRASDELSQVRDTVDKILLKSSEGKYDLDAKMFFTKITKAIDNLQPVIKAQLAFATQRNTDERKNAKMAVNVLYVVTVVVVMFTTVLTFFITRKLSHLMTNITSRLMDNSNKLNIASLQLTTTSQVLSSASNKQADAVNQTSSAIEEISAMVVKSAELADTVEQKSSESRQNAVRGEEIVTRMIEAIMAISRTNDKVAMDMTESNQKVDSILKVLHDIGTKTKVINNIVFQTKLLSFNASVEAARAGESGKGFSVVAEEVGKLAELSGEAAKEINHLLDVSLSTVSKTVDEAKRNVEISVSSAKKTIDQGTVVANECGNVLRDIVSSTRVVSEMVLNISEANQESSKGIDDISKALSFLNSVTQINTTAAINCSQSSEELVLQVQNLRAASSDLNVLVSGEVMINKFEWNDIYLTGVKQMDDEHKTLIQKIQHLGASLNSDSESVLAAFANLSNYIAKHFADEEQFMRSINYPDLENHKAIHKNLLIKVFEFEAQVKKNQFVPNELMAFMNDWLTKHILGADMKYGHYSQEGKVA